MQLLKTLLFVGLLFPLAVLAETYTLSGSWTDPTATGPDYTPAYDVEWRVNAGTVTPIDDLPGPNFSTSVTAAPGDDIEVRVRAENQQGPTAGPWTTWFVATAPNVPTAPAAQTGVVITVTPQ